MLADIACAVRRRFSIAALRATPISPTSSLDRVSRVWSSRPSARPLSTVTVARNGVVILRAMRPLRATSAAMPMRPTRIVTNRVREASASTARFSAALRALKKSIVAPTVASDLSLAAWISPTREAMDARSATARFVNALIPSM